jgi:serine/threonine-protein kinase HipA
MPHAGACIGIVATAGFERRFLNISGATTYEWAHFGYLCKLPFRLVAHELDGLTGKVIAARDVFLADMLSQEAVPAAVAQRVQALVRATCMRQREHVRQIERFKRSDFE